MYEPIHKDYKELVDQFCKGIDAKRNEADVVINELFLKHNLPGPDAAGQWYAALLDYYKETVIPHKIAVYQEGMKIKDAFGLSSEGVKKQLLFHDLSKFSYAEHYYMDVDFKNFKENSPTTIVNFKRAFHHHKANNPHHPEHWFDVKKDGTTIPLEMPRAYVAEMVADWMGAGKTYGSTIEEWLPGNLPNFRFHKKTTMMLSNLLAKHTGIETYHIGDSGEMLGVI